MAEIWDLYCVLDYDQQDCADDLSRFIKPPVMNWEQSNTNEILKQNPNFNQNNIGNMDTLQSLLTNAECSSREFIQQLDTTLGILSDVSLAYSDVTSRTNSLMVNCENLLEQQYSLQATVETLKSMLRPFNDIEAVASQLGIPVDAKGGPITKINNTTLASTNISSSTVDPRSKEFRDILFKLGKALGFLRMHPDFKDSEDYLRWLEQLQHRATALVARAMLDLIDTAKRACISKQLRIASQRTGPGLSSTEEHDDTPLESSPVYQKFRGLGFRMRELGALLATGGAGDDSSRPDMDVWTAESSGGGGGGANQDAQSQVLQTYVLVRCELLQGLVRETTQASAANRKHVPTQSASGPDSAAGVSGSATQSQSTGSGSAALGLCICIRQAYSVLLRLTQLEYQLFESLFSTTTEGSDKENVDSSLISAPTVEDNQGRGQAEVEVVAAGVAAGDRQTLGQVDLGSCPEVRSIVEAVSRATCDCLRPLLIHESDVDSLCRVVTALAEDVRSQILALRLPRILLKCLLSSLDCTVTDAQERLSYCAEVRLRQDVQLFEPLHSQLAYPDILEKAVEQKPMKGRGALTTPGGKIVPQAVQDAAKTWFPPLRYTLALLSKLYGVVDRVIFEDFARRGVSLCVQALRSGADGVRRVRSQLHSDLFLVRHLLVLREQLLPFEIRLTSMEVTLDFSPTGQAISDIVSNKQGWLRFDSNNAIYHIARDGLPALRETQVDVKRELDVALKNACTSLKGSATRHLVGSLEAFLAKVTAFVGEIPISDESKESSKAAAEDASDTDKGSGSSREKRTNWTVSVTSLQNQSFMKPERVKELLQAASLAVIESCPELRVALLLYVENPVARAILLKPIQSDVDIIRRKLETVVAHCVESAQSRRELNQLLSSLASTVNSELTH